MTWRYLSGLEFNRFEGFQTTSILSLHGLTDLDHTTSVFHTYMYIRYPPTRFTMYDSNLPLKFLLS